MQPSWSIPAAHFAYSQLFAPLFIVYTEFSAVCNDLGGQWPLLLTTAVMLLSIKVLQNKICERKKIKSAYEPSGPSGRSLSRVSVAWSNYEYFSSSLDGMLVHRRVTPSSKFASTHLYTWVERGTMRVKCLAQEHNAVPRPGLKPGLFDPESSALTIRSPCLPICEDRC